MEYREELLGKFLNSVSEKENDKLEFVTLINTSDIFNGRVLNHKKVVNENLKGQFKKTFKKGDILFSEIRPANRRFAKVKFNAKGYIASTKLMVLRNKSDEVLDDFIYYYLTSNGILKYLQNQAESRSGTFPQITFKNIQEISVKVPTIPDQKKIISIILSLDKKIEINNKIIENLETQAQAIFKSWFVDFEPFQDGNFVESELGLIPEGWELGKLGKSKLGKIISSGIDEFKDKKIYLATADVSDTSINNISTKITFDDRPSRANMQPKPLSVWFAKMKDSRKLIFVDTTDKEIISRMIFSTGFAGIQANENSFTYLWAYLLSNDFDKIKNAYAMGTTMQAINNKNINNILIAIPTDSILKEFSTITKPMIEIISNLRKQNEKLAQTRDTLLPKLMSGEIDVSNIKIDDEDIDYE